MQYAARLSGENFNTTLKMKFIFTLESITPSDMLREISWQHFMPDFEHSWNANLHCLRLGQVKCVLMLDMIA